MQEFLEFIAVITAVIILSAFVIAPFVLLANHLNHRQCANNVTEMGREYRYDFINGCRIQQEDGTFVFWEMYRVQE